MGAQVTQEALDGAYLQTPSLRVYLLSMLRRECVEHFPDGRAAWTVGVVGLMTRLRGLAGLAVITVLTMGVPWWWGEGPPKNLDLPVNPLLSGVVGLFGASAIVGFRYLRWRTIRSLEVKYALHMFTHKSRDRLGDLAARSKRDLSAQGASEWFTAYILEICGLARTYLRPLIRDDTIEVAVRLAVPQTDGSELYRTIARSSGLNPARAKTSQDLHSSKGIARFFLEKGSRGVLIYNDLAAAARYGAYVLSENDRLYPDEIKTMMVAPINEYDGSSTKMIGLLYVTSRNDTVFSIRDTDAVLFLADHVAANLMTIQSVLAHPNSQVRQ